MHFSLSSTGRKDMGPDEKYYEADLDYCKGCGVCAYECPKKCIQMVHEEV